MVFRVERVVVISINLVSHRVMTIMNKGRSQEEQRPIISGGIREELLKLTLESMYKSAGQTGDLPRPESHSVRLAGCGPLS